MNPKMRFVINVFRHARRSVIFAVLALSCQCFASDLDVAWTMVVLPDTQAYWNANRWPVLNQMTQWIVDNKEARNIQVVLQEGDITDQNWDEQWAAVAQAMGRLNGQVPYMMVTGNHDYYHTPPKLNDYFCLGDNPLNTSPSGIMTTERIAGDLENTYSTITAPDGRNMLIFALEFLPRAEVIDWANDIAALPEYQEHTAVLLTHHYLEEGPATSDGEPTPKLAGSGLELWKKLVRLHPNFELTFNGHSLDKDDTDPYGKLTTARMTSTGQYGNAVHEMVFNAQEQPMGGNGFMRLIEFLNDGRTVQVQTYSPYLDQWLTNDRNLFQLELSPLYAGDYNEDGMIDAADYTVWRDAITSGGTSLANDSTPGTVDESDFLYWRAHFGESFRSGANAASGVVPEPSMLVLLLTALLLLPTRILPFCSPIRSPCRPIH